MYQQVSSAASPRPEISPLEGGSPASTPRSRATAARRARAARRGGKFVALAGAVALVAGACGSTSHSSGGGSTVGVTKDSINIAVTGPFSGIYGPIGDQSYTAAQVWQDQVNAAGGINGRKINLVKVDNQFTPEGAVAACKTVEGDGVLLDLNTIDPGDEVGCEDTAGIPVFVTASGVSAATAGAYKNVTFGRLAAFTNPGTEASFLGSSYLNGKGKKIGLFMEQGPSYTATNNALRAELTQQGYDVVDVEMTSPGGTQSSFVPQVERMRQAGAQVVMLEVVLEAPGIIRDAKAAGYDPEFYLGPLATLDSLSQSSPSQYQGVKGLRYETTTETPAYAAWVNLVRQYLGAAAVQSTTATDSAIYGFLQVLGSVLESAGPNLTRASFVAAAKSVDNYNGLGLIGPFTTKGQAMPVGQQSLFPVVCCNANNTFKLLAPPQAKF